MRLQWHDLPAFSTGTQRRLLSQHFGQPGRGPKVYLQAGLHADEVPPMLVAHHLGQRLRHEEALGRVLGEVVLVPAANPLGLSQELLGGAQGRFDLSTGRNFNRAFHGLTAALAPTLAGQWGDDASHNQGLVRRAAQQWLAAQTPGTETEALKLLLQQLAVDADWVLDLHCDHQATVHLYTGTPLADVVRPLAARLGAEVVLLARESGDDPFDESLSRHWWELAERLPAHQPLPLGCVAATVELRGETDVSHELAAQDAGALIDFLRDIGVLHAPAALRTPLPDAACEPTALEAVEALTAPHSGIFVPLAELGQDLAPGAALAELIDPMTGDSTVLRTTHGGRLFARVARRFVTRGLRVAKVAGRVAHRSGPLLSL